MKRCVYIFFLLTISMRASHSAESLPFLGNEVMVGGGTFPPESPYAGEVVETFLLGRDAVTYRDYQEVIDWGAIHREEIEDWTVVSWSSAWYQFVFRRS